MISVARKESMSSIPISATLMARSPMLLARSQSRMSLNPMALSKWSNVRRGGVVCVVNAVFVRVCMSSWHVCNDYDDRSGYELSWMS